MIVTSKIAIDILAPERPCIVYAMQDDKYSRNLELTLYKGGVACAFASEVAAVVKYAKPDGTGGTYDTLPDDADTPACTIDGNVVTVALAPQVCTVAGTVLLSVALAEGTTVLHTFPLRIEVVANPGLQVASQNYFKVSGALPDSGWTPDMYLGTDADGNVVAKAAPTGGATDEQVAASVEAYMAEHTIASGATEAQAAQIQQNADDIKDLQDNAVELATDLTESGKAADAKMVGDALTVVGASSWDGTLTMAETVADMTRKSTHFEILDEETQTTITETLEDSSTSVIVITKDENKYPTKFTVDGHETTLGWSVSS